MKKIISFLVVSVLLFSICACGSNTSNTSSANQSESTTKESTAAETKNTSSETIASSEAASEATTPTESVELKYISLTNVPTQDAYIEEYNKNNTDGIIISVEQADITELDKRILLAGQANDAYDLMMTNHSSVPQFVSAGILEPLDSYISSSGLDLSKFQDAAVKIGQVDDIQMAIPFNPDCRVIAVNKNVLDKVGIAEADYPKTMTDILAVSQKIKDTDADLYSFAGFYANNWFPVYDFGSFMLGNGGHLYTLENDKYIATADGQGVIDFVKWSQEMYSTMAKDLNINADMVREMFMQEKSAFMIITPGEFNFQDDRFKSGDAILIPFPEGTEKSGSAMGGWTISIGATSKNKELSWQFIETLCQPENMAKFAHALPANMESFNYAPFNDSKYDIFNEQFKSSEYPAPPTPVWSQVAEIFNNYFQQAITGAITAEEACQKANEEIQYELDNM